MERGKKKRSPNFTLEEKENLLSLVTKVKPPIEKRCTKIKTDTLNWIFQVPKKPEKYADVTQQVQAQEILDENGLQLRAIDTPSVYSETFSETSMTEDKYLKFTAHLGRMDALPEVEPKPKQPAIEVVQQISEHIELDTCSFCEPASEDTVSEWCECLAPPPLSEATPSLIELYKDTESEFKDTKPYNSEIETSPDSIEPSEKAQCCPTCPSTIIKDNMKKIIIMKKSSLDTTETPEKPWCCPTCTCSTNKDNKEKTTSKGKLYLNTTEPFKKPWCCPTCSCTTIKDNKAETTSKIKSYLDKTEPSKKPWSCPTRTCSTTEDNKEETTSKGKSSLDTTEPSKKPWCCPTCSCTTIEVIKEEPTPAIKTDSSTICCTKSNTKSFSRVTTAKSCSKTGLENTKTSKSSQKRSGQKSNTCCSRTAKSSMELSHESFLSHDNKCDLKKSASVCCTNQEVKALARKTSRPICDDSLAKTAFEEKEPNGPSTVCHIKSETQPFTLQHTSQKQHAVNEVPKIPAQNLTESKEVGDMVKPKIGIESLIKKLIVNRLQPPSESAAKLSACAEQTRTSGNDNDNNSKAKDTVHVGRSSVELGDPTLRELIHRSSSTAHSVRIDPRPYDREEHNMRVEIKSKLFGNSKEKKKSENKPNSKEKKKSQDKTNAKEKKKSQDKTNAKEKKKSQDKTNAKENKKSQDKPNAKENKNSQDKPNAKENKKSLIKTLLSVSFSSKSSKYQNKDANVEANVNPEPVQKLSSKKKNQLRDPMSRRAGCHVLKRVRRK